MQVKFVSNNSNFNKSQPKRNVYTKLIKTDE